ncbi:hypothetical protein GLW07_08795 [Bacillus hwajinpoensis]|uniref:Cxxc_20_cxxc protein n=1 Tax=Guptibacillus hwajinpoensis TaxID=208199 RepID=A0A845EY44_9BACL|nr:TIGR04104 family putative zinc finger protein [Pseudalkalibacillus hwajinpoensis]MYL63449.1 hypothetical protein [Pseudalkalibacillus hwajinpoensis]
MPTCDNCHNHWNWKQTVKKTTTLNPVMTCPYCRENQYQTKKSKTRIGFLSTIVLLPLLLQIFVEVPGSFLLSLYPILGIIVILLYPFLIKISSSEEHINFYKDK